MHEIIFNMTCFGLDARRLLMAQLKYSTERVLPSYNNVAPVTTSIWAELQFTSICCNGANEIMCLVEVATYRD